MKVCIVEASRKLGKYMVQHALDRGALFMVHALTNYELVHEAPAIVGRRSPSAIAHAADAQQT